jgi:soluble lytic murein transglycosylase-like protein
MARIERIVEGSPPPCAPRAGILHTLAATAALLAGATVPLFSCASPADHGAPGQAQAAALAPMSIGHADHAGALPPTVTRWAPAFAAAGHRHGVDPELLAIVTMVESRGDPDAKSPVGALGLMQVMPSTAERIAQERKLEHFCSETLRDPEVNIDFGAFYLAKQLREFGARDPDHAVQLAVAAYNAGEDAMRAHLTEGTPLPDETKQYMERVVSLWRQRRSTVQ